MTDRQPDFPNYARLDAIERDPLTEAIRQRDEAVRLLREIRKTGDAAARLHREETRNQGWYPSLEASIERADAFLANFKEGSTND